MSSVHSKEVIASIRGLAENGLSASQIALKLECGLNRNKVVGIASRNKITLHGIHGGGPPRKQPPMPKPLYMQCEPVPAEETPTDLITFEQLGPGNCRFPFGDKDFKFCGRSQFNDFPYCINHCRIVYQPRG